MHFPMDHDPLRVVEVKVVHAKKPDYRDCRYLVYSVLIIQNYVGLLPKLQERREQEGRDQDPHLSQDQDEGAPWKIKCQLGTRH